MKASPARAARSSAIEPAPPSTTAPPDQERPESEYRDPPRHQRPGRPGSDEADLTGRGTLAIMIVCSSRPDHGVAGVEQLHLAADLDQAAVLRNHLRCRRYHPHPIVTGHNIGM